MTLLGICTRESSWQEGKEHPLTMPIEENGGGHGAMFSFQEGLHASAKHLATQAKASLSSEDSLAGCSTPRQWLPTQLPGQGVQSLL